MARPLARGSLLAALSLTAFALMASPASATNHLIKIREVFAGAPDHPAAQFVELQMFANGQANLTGHKIVVFDQAGGSSTEFAFPNPDGIATGVSQATLLIATQEAESLFGLNADLEMTPVINPAGGKVCWDAAPVDPVDCFSWGSFTGSAAGSGNPFAPLTGLTGLSARRDISAGNPALLEGGDDTGDSAADFDAATPDPRNNAGQTQTTAGELGVAAGRLGYAAAPGRLNKLKLSRPAPGSHFVLGDTSSPVTAGPGCEQLVVNVVRCPTASITGGDFDTGDSNDVFTSTAPSLPLDVQGGAGVDSLTTGNGADTVNGGEGNDTVKGAAGQDTLMGEAGNDRLEGGPAADDLDGGAGTDTGAYPGRTEGLTIDLDGDPDDGGGSDQSGARRDNVMASVENLLTGPGDDILTGSSQPNLFDPGFGADTVDGLGGPDTVTYAPRTAAVVAALDGQPNSGNADDGPAGARDALTAERLIGGKQNDELTGDDNPNQLTGGAGQDTLTALGGDDTVFAKDGLADTISCGLGADEVRRDLGIDLFPTTGDEACETQK